MSTALVVLVVLALTELPLPFSLQRVCTLRTSDFQLLTIGQTPSKLVTSSRSLQSLSSKLTLASMRWPATAVVVVAAVVGEVAVAVEEAAAADVAVGFVSLKTTNIL
jgi:hypothetical protein